MEALDRSNTGPAAVTVYSGGEADLTKYSDPQSLAFKIQQDLLKVSKVKVFIMGWNK